MVTSKMEVDYSGTIAFGAAIKEVERDLKRSHAAKAGHVVKVSKRNLEAGILRPQEQGFRPNSRLTGTLFGPRRRSVKGRAFVDGKKQGWGFPDVRELDRHARHWRALEQGLPKAQHFMPTGVFINKGGAVTQPRGGRSGDRFVSYRDYVGRADDDKPMRRSNRRNLRKNLIKGGFGAGGGIRAKNFLRDAFNEVAKEMPGEYEKIVNLRYRSWLK